MFWKSFEYKKEYMDARHNLNSISVGKDNIKVTERELRKVLTLYEWIINIRVFLLYKMEADKISVYLHLNFIMGKIFIL